MTLLIVSAVVLVLVVLGMYAWLLWWKYAAPPRPGRHRTGEDAYHLIARLHPPKGDRRAPAYA